MNIFTQDIIVEFNKALLLGYKKFLVWGWNYNCLEFLDVINILNKQEYIVAIVDDKSILQRTYNGLDIYPPSCIRTVSFDSIIITCNTEKDEILFSLKDLPASVHLIFSGDDNYNFKDKLYDEVVKNNFVKSKAGGYENILIHLFQSIQYVIKNNIIGEIVELGTYKGGTTFYIADILKKMKSDKKIYSFDTFEGFPEKSNILDLFMDYKYSNNNYDIIKKQCLYYDNVQLVKGNILNNIHDFSVPALSLLFCDTDNFSATYEALNILYSKISIGGILAFDHYFSPSWGKTIGERIAIKMALKDKNVFNLHGTGIFLKISD